MISKYLFMIHTSDASDIDTTKLPRKRCETSIRLTNICVILLILCCFRVQCMCIYKSLVYNIYTRVIVIFIISRLRLLWTPILNICIQWIIPQHCGGVHIHTHTDIYNIVSIRQMSLHFFFNYKQKWNIQVSVLISFVLSTASYSVWMK